MLRQAAPGGARAEVEHDEARAAFVGGVDDESDAGAGGRGVGPQVEPDVVHITIRKMHIRRKRIRRIHAIIRQIDLRHAGIKSVHISHTFHLIHTPSIFGPPGCAYGIDATPCASITVGRPVSTTHSVSGLPSLSGVIYSACTEIKPVLLLEPKGMPFQEVFSWEVGRFKPAEGYGVSAVLLTTSPSV
jgi:hypothetical protein